MFPVPNPEFIRRVSWGREQWGHTSHDMNADNNRSEKLTLVRAGTILTMAGSPIRDGAILIRDGHIADIGAFERVRADLGSTFAGREIGSPEQIAMPGMVDAHQHGRGLSQFQAGVQDAPLEPMQAARLASRVPDINPYADTLYACHALLQSGVTTVVHAPIVRDPLGENVRGEIEAVFQGYADSGIRVLYSVPIGDQNSFVYGSDESFFDSLPQGARNSGQQLTQRRRGLDVSEYFELVEQLRANATEYPAERVTIALGPSGPQWCSDALLKKIRAYATDNGLLIHTHCVETPYQREYGNRRYGRRVIEHLTALDFLGPDVTLGHCVWADQREIEILAETSACVAHNPSSNVRLRCGIAPLLPLLEAGVTVGLGSDSLTWNDDHDFFQEIRAAYRLHRLPGLSDQELSAADALQMATRSGAQLLGRAGEFGQLSIGARADIVLVNIEPWAAALLGNELAPNDYLAQRAQAQHVDAVLVDGEIVVEGGRHPGLDHHYIAAELQRTANGRAKRERTQFVQEIAPHVAGFYADWGDDLAKPHYALNVKGG